MAGGWGIYPDSILILRLRREYTTAESIDYGIAQANVFIKVKI